MSTLKVDTIRPVTTDGSLTLQGDSSGAGVTGITIDSSGNTTISSGLTVEKSAAAVSTFNRTTSDGDIAVFLKGSTTIGSIGSSTSVSGTLFIAGDSGLQFRSSDILPTNSSGSYTDGALDLGDNAAKFQDIYATNATIQTSDRNEKQDIEELSEAEQRVAIACKGLLRKFRWKDMVAKKGDDARIHFGIIAQDLKAAFDAEGLNASRYGVFIHSEWWETEETYTDDDGAEKTHTGIYDTEEEAPEGAVKKDRMGIRYSELLAFIISAI